MQLAAQDIRDRCMRQLGFAPMIEPFSETRQIVNGKSYGLSAASYDVRIAHDLVLGIHPGVVLRDALLEDASTHRALMAARERLREQPPHSALAYTLERFCMPNDVAAFVCDKSSYARVMVSAFNTLFDPGWRGIATLELVNLGEREVIIQAGDPICQIVFHQLTRPTDRAYVGKYQDQPARPVAARYECEDGSHWEDQPDRRKRVL
jgi:dCTP deaminase